MRLLFDAGNTRIKWAIADVETNEILSRGVLERDWSILANFANQIESVWVSSVAEKSTLAEIKAQVGALFGLEAHIVSVTKHALGMVNNYEDLSKLGVDRWVAALGARFIAAEGALIVIDAGTAVTIDLVSPNNRFEGGVILPGFSIMHDALLGRTAGIESSRQSVASVVGKNTRDCVNAGVQYGLIGAIEKIICEIISLLNDEKPRLLIMGGDAEAIVASSELDLELQSDMIFYGLMQLSEK